MNNPTKDYKLQEEVINNIVEKYRSRKRYLSSSDWHDKMIEELTSAEMQLLINIKKQRSYKDLTIKYDFKTDGYDRSYYKRLRKNLLNKDYIYLLEKRIFINLFKYPIIEIRELNQIFNYAIINFNKTINGLNK